MALPLVGAGAALASREFAKQALKRKLAEAAAKGTGAAALGVGAAGVGEALVSKSKAKDEAAKPKREESKMGSSKNADAGTGRGTSTFDSGNKSFNQAFREARKSGQDTFTWNGKKYTTEMAGEKKSAASSEPERETTEYDFGATNPSEFKRGGKVKKMASGGAVKSSASKRADGCVQRGKTRGRII